MQQRIVLVHATPLAMAPINEAFARLWPEASVSNLLDDALSVDRRREDNLTPHLYQRIADLVAYSQSIEARAILFTCSAFGEAIDASAAGQAVPVLKPNEAMFEQALNLGNRIVMLATFGPAVAGMEAEFADMASRISPQATLRTFVIADARDALETHNPALHNRLLAEKAATVKDADVILLAHFSMAIALDQVQAAVTCPVLSSPQAAVNKLKSLLK
ncbi:aspartate/glutamate racemase family protein [Kosakonia sp.]|uniref:aspartate/glutamate racemase family protein n=1 Tax=Kosakonia sp. TaxID=1916651 RepID=UPI00289BEA56|nr:aspartate/glutamate racemase family protein [Kosakonia sp.]